MVSSTPITSGWPSGTNAFSNKPSRILEPVRPDHAPRDKNRWNRLNPLSDVPSTARSAAHTVRRFRHSRAPVASATAFSHDGCVNIPANGSSQISMPGRCRLHHSAPWLAPPTRSSRLQREDGGGASPVPLLRSPCPDAFRICSRSGNPPPPSSTPQSLLMTRAEILTRYRRLRQISKEHHQAVLDIIAPGVMLDWAKRWAKRLGLTQ